MRHDVVFTVYRLRIPLPIVSHSIISISHKFLHLDPSFLLSGRVSCQVSDHTTVSDQSDTCQMTWHSSWQPRNGALDLDGVSLLYHCLLKGQDFHWATEKAKKLLQILSHRWAIIQVSATYWPINDSHNFVSYVFQKYMVYMDKEVIWSPTTPSMGLSWSRIVC